MIVNENVPPEDYSRYMVIVELKSSVIQTTSFFNLKYPVHKINVSGKDFLAGERRLWILIYLPDLQTYDIPPIGFFPGTRIVIPSDVRFELTGLTNGKDVRYLVSGGAIDVRFDNTIRLENAHLIPNEK
jgi:hypothetical protein